MVSHALLDGRQLGEETVMALGGERFHVGGVEGSGRGRGNPDQGVQIRGEGGDGGVVGRGKKVFEVAV